jgi:hypothetical protein
MFFDIKQDFAANAVAMELVTEKCSKARHEIKPLMR